MSWAFPALGTLQGNCLGTFWMYLWWTRWVFPRYIVHVLAVYLQCPGSGNWYLSPVFAPSVMRWTMRFVGRSIVRGAGQRGRQLIPMQEAVAAFHNLVARSSFDKILEGLSRQNVADEIMERVAGAEIAQQVRNVATVLHLPEDHPVMTMVELNLWAWGLSAQPLILSGEVSSYWLDLQVLLTNEEGDILFGSLVSDREVSSDNEIVSRRIKSVDRVEDEEVVEALGEWPPPYYFRQCFGFLLK